MAAALGDQNPRFKGENILVMELDLPDRRTYDYDGEESILEAQSALDAVLDESNHGSILPLDNIVNSTFKDDSALGLKKASKTSRGKMRRFSVM